jgi:hypothetical protein
MECAVVAGWPARRRKERPWAASKAVGLKGQHFNFGGKALQLGGLAL